MKLTVQWKDPDFSISGFADEAGRRIYDFYKLPEDIQEKLTKMGAQEYLVAEFDLETGQTRVIGEEE